MTARNLIALTAAAAAALMSAPVLANNDRTPPGNPCAKNNGNPCNGNNGNIGEQGNADKEKVKIDRTPPPIDLAMPPVSGRGAFITQIGDGNVATIAQAAPNAYARVDQDGDRNEADVTQRGSGTGYIDAMQTGDANFARLQQDGSGHNVVHLAQSGTGNWAWSNQTAVGALHNGAILAQAGNNNDMALHQNGSDNRALLTQEGDGNGMTAVQNGDGNRLAWTQQGTNLSDLAITQNGGQAIQVTQTGAGN